MKELVIEGHGYLLPTDLELMRKWSTNSVLEWFLWTKMDGQIARWRGVSG